MAGSDWNATLYNDKLSFVTAYGEALLDLLAPQPGEFIVDLGCGTGKLTAQIAASGARVVGLDASPNMIERAKADYPDLDFRVADAAEFELEEPADALFSNAALHWVTRASEASHAMARALKPGGRLVLEMGGKGNVQTLLQGFFDALGECGCCDARHKWFFPSVGEYASILESAGFEVTAAWHFDRWTELSGADGLRAWYTAFGEGIHANVDAETYQRAITIAEDLVRGKLFQDGVWYADYRRLRIVAKMRS